GLLEAGGRAADELEGVPALAPALDLAVGELVGVDAAHRAAVGIADLGEVRAPFDRVRLRAHDRLPAREAPATALCFFHQLRNPVPRLARLRRVDAADAVHRRRIEHVALAVADFVRGARPRGEVAVARAVDEHPAAHRAPTRFGLDDDGLDRIVRGF